jgi:hypothetical protein
MSTASEGSEPAQLALTATPVAKDNRASAKRASVDAHVFRRLRDEVLNALPAGRHYAALYATHSPEVVRLVLTDGTLRSAVWNGLLAWQGNAAALVDSRGAIVATEAQARAVDAVMERLSLVGSPGLRHAVQVEISAHGRGVGFARNVLRAIGR